MPIAIRPLFKAVPMPTRNVVLTDHQAELVERLVSSGRYQNASEVLREGLRLIETRDAEEKARLKALREAARVGLEDAEAGRFRRFESAAELKRHLDSIADQAIGAGEAPGADPAPGAGSTVKGRGARGRGR
jgi:antitoxin ParD1/3/4